MSLESNIRRIVQQELPNYVNLNTSLRSQQNVQDILGTVSAINSNQATVTFADGSTTTATITCTRPLVIGAYVLVVGGNIL